MAPIVELLRAPATEAFKKDGVKVSQGAIDIVSKTAGSLRYKSSRTISVRQLTLLFSSTFTGVEVQDPNYWYVANGA